MLSKTRSKGRRNCSPLLTPQQGEGEKEFGNGEKEGGTREELFVWIFDPSVGKWAMGAPLPKASLGATDKTISFRGYCFGQASSHAGFIYYSGGATLAVNNTYKTRENGPLNKYEYVSFTKVMRLDPNTEEWAQVWTGTPPWENFSTYGLPLLKSRCLWWGQM